MVNLNSTIGRKLPKSIRGPVGTVYLSYYPILHYILGGHIFGLVVIRKYLRDNQIRKLQIGCGPNWLEGWLNTDIVSGNVYLNANRKMPFKDNTFNFIFCEHFLEHISLNEGIKFLKECHRILKIGGVIRISTPDLEKVIDLYFDKNRLIKRKELMKAVYGREMSPCELFNGCLYDWGHKLIYDKNLITSMLSKTGFANVTFCENRKSNHKELANLEMHNDIVNQAETLIVEARK